MEEFAIYFMGLIKSQTEEFTKVNSSKCNTPQKFTGIPVDDKKLLNGISNNNNNGSNNNGSIKTNALHVYKRNLSRDLFPEECDLVKKSASIEGGDGGQQEEENSVSEHFQKYQQCENSGVSHSHLINRTANSSSHSNSSCHIKSYANLEKRLLNSTSDSDHVIHSSPIPNKSISSLMSMTSTPINKSGKNGSRNLSSFEHKTSSTSHKKSGDKSSSHSAKKSTSFTLSDFVLATTITPTNSKAKRKSLNAGSTMAAVMSHQEDGPGMGGTKGKVTNALDANFPELSSSVNVSSSKREKTLSNSQNVSKPIKRVVPITLSRNVSHHHHNDFMSSSFKSENNLMEFNCDEEKLKSFDNRNKMDELDRKFLMTKNDDIIKCFEDGHLDNPSTRGLYATLKENIPPSDRTKIELKINLNKITNRRVLNAFIEIYSTIIDLNLTTNVLSEISYLINLLNLEVFDATTIEFRNNSISETEIILTDTLLHVNEYNGFCDEMLIVLRNINNCIYFALETLSKQRCLLALLDTTTLKVLIDNERITSFNSNLLNYLKRVLSHKQSLDSIIVNDVSFSLGNALFQQENDSKSNFPTEKEFGGFKKQRDMFYTILRTWEVKHLNPMWSFSTELGSKVKALIAVLDHPINMAHLSKLFIAQLLISCNFDNSTSDLQMALPNIDLNKLSKLRQRLIAPSSFSMQYLFSGNQIFFRDFIVAAFSSNSFIEQLKIALVNELTDMNNSSFELINLSNEEHGEYVVRPETISTMRILAKFIGFIMAQTFQYDNYRNTQVDNRQINLRNKIVPGFDIKEILVRAITDRKLIITIPWLVQYISMLDYITLRLDYYKEVFYVLYELYILSCNQTWVLIGLMTPTTTFIVRTCLGWLFEHPNVPDDYYNYRENRLQLCMNSKLCNESGLTMNSTEYRILKIFVRKMSNDKLRDYSLVMQKYEDNGTHFKCILEPIVHSMNRNNGGNNSANETVVFNEMKKSLEGVLIASCPFLADFRVSVMPTKITKSLSRTGRYRHITTKYSSDAALMKQKSTSQNQLLDAFLQSQTLSVRRTVEFVIERATSAAIKDFQIETFYPLKLQSNQKVKDIKLRQQNAIVNEIHQIYSAALRKLYTDWDEKIPKMLLKRIKLAFEAFMPAETLDIVQKTCVNIVYQKSMTKANDWRSTNMSNIDIFSKDIYGDAFKIMKSTNNAQIMQQQQLSHHIDLKIDNNCTVPSTVFMHLQSVLHSSSQLPGALSATDLNNCMKNLIECVKTQLLSNTMYRIAAYMVLQLSLLLVSNCCDLVTTEYLCLIFGLWKLDKILPYTTPPDVNEDDGEEEEKPQSAETTDASNIKNNLTPNNYIFATMINCRYFRIIKNKSQKELFCLSNFLNQLIKHNFITLDLLNGQFVTLFTEDWNETEYQNISILFDSVLKNSDNEHMDKSGFFLDMLSDLAKDIDF